MCLLHHVFIGHETNKLTRPNEVGNRPMNTCCREGVRAAGSANDDIGMKMPW